MNGNVGRTWHFNRAWTALILLNCWNSFQPFIFYILFPFSRASLLNWSNFLFQFFQVWLIAKFYFALQGNSFRNWKTLQSFLIDLFIFSVHTVLFYCINSHPHTSKIDQNRPKSPMTMELYTLLIFSYDISCGIQ